MIRHPYDELAEGIEDRLREQRGHDRRNDGVCLFASEDAEAAARARAAELRRLARLDREQGWPWDDGTPPLDLAATP
jgi:hypothetical protein